MASVIETGGYGFERIGAVSSYTTTTLPAVNAAHWPIVVVKMRQSAARPVTSVTLGGVAMTPLYEYDSNSSNQISFFIGTKGQTGQAVVTFSGGSIARGSVELLPISNAAATGWTLSDTSFSTSATTTNVNFPIDVVDDGVIVAASYNSGNGGSVPSWVGVDLVQTIPIPLSSPSNIVTLAAKVITPAETNRTITSGWSNGNARTNAAISLAPVVSAAIGGDAAQSLGGLTSTASAKLLLSAQASSGLGALTTSTASAAILIKGSAASSLGALSGVASALLPVSGSCASTLGAIASASAAELDLSGQGLGNLSALGLSASAALQNSGSVASTLGELVGAGVSMLPGTGQSIATLDPITGVASGQSPRIALGDASLGGLLGASSGASSTPAAGASATGDLGVMTGTLSGASLVRAEAAVDLAPADVTASAASWLEGGTSASLGPLTGACEAALVVEAVAIATMGNLTGIFTGRSAVLVTPPGRTVFAGAESRSVLLPYEHRYVAAKAENRTIIARE